jgi:hypothetical protein
MCSAAIALVCASAFAGTVYKWVDEKGVVHYSDQPHPNAQSVDLKSAQTYQSTGATPSPGAGASANARPTAYRLCQVTRPENDEVFLNTDTVVAKVRLEPQLRQGDQIAIALDGKRVQTGSSSDITLKVERGSHSLNAVVEDSDAKPVCTTANVTFHVRQPSTQAPNRANRPRF